LTPTYTEPALLTDLRDFLFDKSGNCSVYFHIDMGNNPYVVKASQQITINATDDNLKALRDFSAVKNVWTE